MRPPEHSGVFFRVFIRIPCFYKALLGCFRKDCKKKKKEKTEKVLFGIELCIKITSFLCFIKRFTFAVKRTHTETSYCLKLFINIGKNWFELLNIKLQALASFTPSVKICFCQSDKYLTLNTDANGLKCVELVHFQRLPEVVENTPDWFSSA